MNQKRGRLELLPSTKGLANKVKVALYRFKAYNISNTDVCVAKCTALRFRFNNKYST